MAQRTVDPTKIKTLADWAARWPKATNLGFDTDTREPTIYDTTKERTKISSIKWKREVDTIAILTQPTRYSARAVETATARYSKYRETRAAMKQSSELQIREAEAQLLEAWRAYRVSPPASRGALMGSIMEAERELRQQEENAANKGRLYVKTNEGHATYIPPMPTKSRGFAVEETV